MPLQQACTSQVRTSGVRVLLDLESQTIVHSYS